MVAIRLLNLRTWSETVPSYALRWRDLELFLFRDEGKILTALGWRRVPVDQLNQISAKRQIVGITLFMPFAGMSAYVGGYDARQRIEVDGLGELAWIFSVCCFVLAVWGPPMVASRWWRAERHWDGLELLYLATTVPFSVVTLIAMKGQDGTDVWSFPLISLPVWLTAVPAAIVLMAMVASRGRRRRIADHFRREGTPDPALANDLIARLDPARREYLIDERAAAIVTLQRRGLIDGAQVSDLASRPLGSLATTGR